MANILDLQSIMTMSGLTPGTPAYAAKLDQFLAATQQPTTLLPGDPLPSNGEGQDLLTSFLPGGAPADWGGLMGRLAGTTAGKAGVTALVAGGVTLGTVAAAGYGLSQLIGVQYPWETGPGEGFIAPWNRDIVKDENGKWVTRATRPDLFAGASSMPAFIGGSPVVKQWTTGPGGWPFAMTQDGKIHTFTKNGVLKSWKPKKPIVLSRGSTTLSQAVKAQKYLDKMWRTIAKKTKQLKLA